MQHALKLDEEQYVERIRRDTAKSLADVQVSRVSIKREKERETKKDRDRERKE